MAVLVSERINIGVDVAERATTATVNWVLQVVLRVLHFRHLSPQDIIDGRETIEKGLFTWLAEQTLVALSLEIFEPGRSDALERFDFEFTYQAEMESTVRNSNIANVEEFCQKLQELPSGAAYRVVITTQANATEVEGWVPGEFRPLDIATEQVLSDHGFANIGTAVVYRGGRR